MIGLLEPGVCDHEQAVVEDVMTDEAVHELERVLAKVIGLGGHLLKGLGQAVGDRHLCSPERAHELGLGVAGDAQRVP